MRLPIGQPALGQGGHELLDQPGKAQHKHNYGEECKNLDIRPAIVEDIEKSVHAVVLLLLNHKRHQPKLAPGCSNTAQSRQRRIHRSCSSPPSPRHECRVDGYRNKAKGFLSPRVLSSSRLKHPAFQKSANRPETQAAHLEPLCVGITMPQPLPVMTMTKTAIAGF